MGQPFIISIDLGTTGNRVFCFGVAGEVLGSAYRELTQHFPRPGWVEHDAEEIWSAVARLIPEALAQGGLVGRDALGIGITNQRETTVLWDTKTGRPVHRAIVWQCRRTAEICEGLKDRGLEESFRRRTGLVLDAYFSGTKIKWLLDNVPGARGLADAGRLKFGTVDSWVLWQLTGGAVHRTDHTNASRTLVYDIGEKQWSKELTDLLDIPESVLPEVLDSAAVFGETRGVAELPDGIVIGGIAGDQQAALVGQGCTAPGSCKNTYGTGCFLLKNMGDEFVLSNNGLLTTLACDARGQPVYALEGSVFIGGAVVQWLRDYMEFIETSADSERLAESLDGVEDQVVVVPAFVGLGAPHWNADARGAVFGLTRDTSREQIVRASLRSIALQSRDVIAAMEEDTGNQISDLRVDGSATANNYLMQYQADILDATVLLPANIESTALGAAYLAGLTAGLWETIDEVAANNRVARTFTPRMDAAVRLRHLELWNDAVRRLV